MLFRSFLRYIGQKNPNWYNSSCNRRSNHKTNRLIRRGIFRDVKSYLKFFSIEIPNEENIKKLEKYYRVVEKIIEQGEKAKNINIPPKTDGDNYTVLISEIERLQKNKKQYIEQIESLLKSKILLFENSTPLLNEPIVPSGFNSFMYLILTFLFKPSPK